ncbi:MAG: alpha-mannosidase [Theionarchaea archaeon]|nr:alpha-mannosidase [Theionarchaea archaeon]
MYIYRRLADWKTGVGEFPDAIKPNFDDSNWDTISPGWTWNRGEGERWFRRKFVVPDEVKGIEVEGSTLYLRIVVLAGIELYIDGEFVDSADYWFDGLHVLAEKARAGETHVLTLRSPTADGNGHFNFAEWYLAEVEDRLIDIGLVNAKGQLIRDLVDLGEFEGDLPAAAEVKEYDTEVSLPELHDSIVKIGEELMPVASSLEDLTTYLVGHAHIDMNWLWDWEDTIETTRRTFTSIEKLMGEFPELIFSQSQAAVYRIMQDHCPQIFEDIRKRVKEGRWNITASTWVEGDLNMASGESLVRQTTCALNYIEENFDVTPRIAWCPDTFGHPRTYPQILSKCGIEYYYAHRCTRPEGEHLFWWESPDGSRVLVFNEGVTYNNKIEPELAKSIPKMMKNFGVKSHLVVFGVGDHGGGPTRMDLLNGRRISSERGFPRLRYAASEEFYDSVRVSEDIPIVGDELNFVFEGCYTTHSDIKRMNRRGEAMLYESEVLGSLASTKGRDYPHHLLVSAWQSVLFNQFHDLLDGSGIHVAYEHSHEIFNEASDICSGITRVSLPVVLGMDGTGGDSEFLSVFNTLGWERVETVRFRGAGAKGYSSVLEESTGIIQPMQVEGDSIIFTARVPGVGHSLYRFVKENPGEEADADSPRAIAPTREDQPYVLENRFFRLVVDQGSGAISSLIDKRLCRNLVGPTDPVTEPINVFQLCYEKPHGMSAWRIGPISRIDNLLDGASIEVASDGPLLASLRIKREFGKSSSLVQEIVLHRDVARIDFETEIDWQEIGGPDIDSPMLKVAFPLSHSSATCVREIPFGHMESPTDGREIPSLTFLDLPGDGFGVSILNDSKYGHDVRGNTIRLTLLRAAYDPDPRPDVGVHKLTYSLLPHRGNWTQAEVWKQGHAINHPLNLVPGRAEIPSGSWITFDASGVDLTALKLADSGDALVIRLVEMHGREVSFDLSLGWKANRLVKCNLRELPTGEFWELESGRTRITLEPYEVCTLRVE